MEEVERIIELLALEGLAPNPDITYGHSKEGLELSRMQKSRREAGFHFPRAEGIKSISDAVPMCYSKEETGPLLCVGSGKALIEYLVSLTGIEVIATDPGLTHGSGGLLTNQFKTFMPVEILTANEAVEKHSEANCFMTVWPGWKEDWSGEFVEKIVEKKNPRTRIIHIGGGVGGLTGNHRFHELLSEHFEMESEISGNTWPGMYDSVQIWGPKTPDSDEESEE